MTAKASPPFWQGRYNTHPAVMKSTGDQGQDFFGKGNDDAAGNRQHTVCSLRRIMGLQAETELQDAEAKQNDTDRPDKAEDEVAKVVDNSDRIIVRKRRGCKRKSKYDRAKDAEDHVGSFGHFHIVVSSVSFSSSRMYCSALSKLKASLNGI